MHNFWCAIFFAFFALFSIIALAEGPQPLITAPINESQLVTLGNTPPAALRAANDRGPVNDSLRLRSFAVGGSKVRRSPEARLAKLIRDEMHNPGLCPRIIVG